MSIKAVISNYRGVSAATLEIDKITLVAAVNGGGKSSCCQAVGAALTGEACPIDNENGASLSKSQAGVLVRSGTAAGRVELSGPAGATEIAWPSTKAKSSGQAPAASAFAAGLNSIVSMEIKKRIPFLIDYLKAQPTKENLVETLQDLNLGWVVKFPNVTEGCNEVRAENGRPVEVSGVMYQPESGTVDKLWDLIQTQGWDQTYSQIKEKGAKYKGQWEAVTNANYGPKAASSWIPVGHEPNLEGSSEDTLKACVTDARDALEAAISASAVDDSKRQDLEAIVDLLLERQTALDAAKQPLLEDEALKVATISMQAARSNLTAAQTILNNLRAQAPKAGDPPKKLFCSCGKELMMDAAGNLCDYTLGGPTQAEIEAHAVKVSNQVKAVNTLTETVKPLDAEVIKLGNARQAVVNAWNLALSEASRLVRESMQAKAELDAMAAPVLAQVGASVEQCRNDLAAHELRLKAFQSKRQADGLHKAIEMNQALLKHIAPTGVRADVLTHAIGNFNTVLSGLSDIAGWAPSQITPEFGFTFNGTPLFLLSSAEQFRVRTVVQVAMAMHEKSAMIVVDGADILDKGGRNGLFKLLNSAGIPALVGMTINVEAEVPNLAKAGYGRSYWIGSSVAKEI